MNVVKISCIVVALIVASAVAWHFIPKANMDYAFAQRANTAASYQHFLDKYPNDQRKQTVLAQIDQLSWETAKQSNSITGFADYIQRFPNGKFVKDANALKDNLEIATLPVFEGSVSAMMGIGGGLGPNGEIYLGGPMLELETSDGKYQLLRTDKTTYRNMKETDDGVEWNLYKRFRIHGNLTVAPKGEHIGGVKFIDTRVVEQLEK